MDEKPLGHQIKQPEIHHEDHPHEGKKKSKALYVLIFLTVGLLIFSGVQTFQINGLEEKMAGSGAVTAGKSAAASAPRIPAAATPQMVGGC